MLPGTAEGVFRALEVRRIEQKDRWGKEAINNVIGVLWRLVDGECIVDRPMTQINPLPPPALPFEGARVQRERMTMTDMEAFGTTAGCPGCNAIRSGKRAQAHSDPCRARIEECLKTTPEGAERLDRRSEVLNEALAKDVEINTSQKKGNRTYCRRVGGSTWSRKTCPSHPNQIRDGDMQMKAATAVASSNSSKIEGSRTVAETPTQQNSMADGSRMDVEGGRDRGESKSSKAQNIRRRILTKTSVEESRTDDEGEEGDEFRSSTVPNVRRRIATKNRSLEENKSGERTVALTTEEALDGIREKAQ